MKNNVLKSENPLSGRVLVIDFPNRKAWDITTGKEKYYESVPSKTIDLLTAMRMSLHEIAFQSLRVSVQQDQDYSGTEFEEIIWQLSLLNGLITDADDDLFKQVESLMMVSQE